MGHPINETTQRRIRLVRIVIETLRGMIRDQWVGGKRIIEDPQIYDYIGEIKRRVLGDAVMYVNRNMRRR